MILPQLPFNLPPDYSSDLLKWASEHVNAQLALKEPQNEWLRLEKTIDWESIEKACANYHKRSSGANVPHSVKRLVRVLFAKWYLGVSLREMERRVRYDMQLRRFAGYGWHERVPDHSTIERFEVWVSANQPRLYFDTVLKEVDKRYGVEERAKNQYGDTFGMHANAARCSLITLLRASSVKLVSAATQANGMSPEAAWMLIDTQQLLGEAAEKHWSRLTQVERDERLTQTVKGAVACQCFVRTLPHTDAQTQQRLTDLTKILADEVEVTFDEAGTVTHVRRLSHKEQGSYRIGSAVDTEATYREHGKGNSIFGYNISVATTDEFVREIAAHTGATPDAQPIPSLLEAQKTHHHHLPDKFIYDKAAGDGKSVRRVHEATDGQTQLVVHLRDYDKRSPLFSPRDFHFDHHSFSLTCPNGVSSTRFYRHGTNSGWTVRFRRDDDGCSTCPLIQQCYKKPDSQQHRNVFISDSLFYFALALAYMTTDSFPHEMRQRSHVERIIAALVRYHPARYARRRGTAAADFQVKMAATAYNAKKLLRKILLDPLPSRSASIE